MMQTEKRMVVGLDPSITGAAVAKAINGIALPDDIREFSATGLTQLPASQRVEAYRRHAQCIADGWLPHTRVFMEGYSFGSTNAATALGEFGGILRLVLIDEGHIIMEVAPKMLKKFSAEKGNASKVAVGSGLAKRYGVAFKTDNEADGYGLLRIGMCVLGDDEPQTKAQREVIAALKKDWDVMYGCAA